MKNVKISDNIHKQLKIFVAEFGGGLTATAFADKAIYDHLIKSGHTFPKELKSNKQPSKK